MPALSLFKTSDKSDKDKDKDSSSSPTPPSSSTPPPAVASASTSTSTSKFHPTRLLRRKASGYGHRPPPLDGSKSSETETTTSVSDPPSAKTQSTFSDFQEQYTRDLAIARMGEGRRGSDPNVVSMSMTAAGVPGGSAQGKREGWVYSPKEGLLDPDLSGASGDEAGLSPLIRSGIPPRSQSLRTGLVAPPTAVPVRGMRGTGSISSHESVAKPPPILHGGGERISKGLMNHPLLDNSWSRGNNPASPSHRLSTIEGESIDSFPAALSPPRRSMPRSPRAQRSQGTPTATATPPSHHSLSNAVRRGSSPTPYRASPSMNGTSAAGTSAGLTRETAAWLSAAPSSTGAKDRIPRKNSLGAERIRQIGLESPSKAPRTPSGARRRAHESSSGAEDSSNGSSDGEIRAGEKRRSLISAAGGTGYEVVVSCADRRSEADEIKWEVCIRRNIPTAASTGSSSGSGSTMGSGSIGTTGGGGVSPLALGISGNIAQAPGSASSINLSLSLDQPTGKLVFIAFPMDIHATPTKRRPTPKPKSPGQGQGQGFSPSTSPMAPPAGVYNAPTTPPLREITPPPQFPLSWTLPSNPHSRRNSVELLKSFNGKDDSPSTPVSKRRDLNELISPHSRSSSASPAGTGGSPAWTPRRTRLVTAAELDGGLYAKGTVDGLSEELEEALILGPELRKPSPPGK